MGAKPGGRRASKGPPASSHQFYKTRCQVQRRTVHDAWFRLLLRMFQGRLMFSQVLRVDAPWLRLPESACACPPSIEPARSGLAPSITRPHHVPSLPGVQALTFLPQPATIHNHHPIATLCIAQPVFSSTPPVAKL